MRHLYLALVNLMSREYSLYVEQPSIYLLIYWNRIIPNYSYKGIHFSRGLTWAITLIILFCRNSNLFNFILKIATHTWLQQICKVKVFESIGWCNTGRNIVKYCCINFSITWGPCFKEDIILFISPNVTSYQNKQFTEGVFRKHSENHSWLGIFSANFGGKFTKMAFPTN